VASGGHCLEGFVSDPEVRVIIDVVVRYWFRSPDAAGHEPTVILPRAPASMATFKAEWSWSDVDQASFTRLLRNHGTWAEQNAGVDSPNASLWALLEIHRKQLGKIVVRGVSTAGPGAERQMDDHLAALSEGVGAYASCEFTRMSWLEFALNPLPDLFAAPPGGVSAKVKDALLDKRSSDRQISTAYDYLTCSDHDVMGGMLGLARQTSFLLLLPAQTRTQARFEVPRCDVCDVRWRPGPLTLDASR
jgi:hypothetical protein